MYSFDPVGSYEREACRAAGAAQALVQPFLDNQVSPRRIQRLRCGVCAQYLTSRFVPDLRPLSTGLSTIARVLVRWWGAVDILQEPGCTDRAGAPDTFTPSGGTQYCYRLVYQCDGAAYRGKRCFPFQPALSSARGPRGSGAFLYLVYACMTKPLTHTVPFTRLATVSRCTSCSPGGGVCKVWA